MRYGKAGRFHDIPNTLSVVINDSNSFTYRTSPLPITGTGCRGGYSKPTTRLPHTRQAGSHSRTRALTGITLASRTRCSITPQTQQPRSTGRQPTNTVVCVPFQTQECGPHSNVSCLPNTDHCPHSQPNDPCRVPAPPTTTR